MSTNNISATLNDTTPPSLISLTFPNIINLYGGRDRIVTFEANAFDALSGVSYVFIFFDKTIATISPLSGGSWGGIHYESLPFLDIYKGWNDATPNVGSENETFLSINNPGTYNIESVSISDLAGNSVHYTPTELHNLGIATSFEVIGSKADITAPVLTKLIFPANVDISKGNQSVNFEVNAYDNGVGVDSVTINFDKKLDTGIGHWDSLGIYTDEWVDETPNYGIRNESILSTNTPGTYKITSVKVEDRVGNSTIYSSDDLKSMGIKTSFNISTSLKINGTTGNDNLIGSESNDTLNGLAGNDTLNGGLGTDEMTGGLGNDTYYVDNTGDIVTETSTITSEIDSVNSLIAYTLTANVENLTLTGNATINGTGNSLNNFLSGNAEANILRGGLGNDTLIGGSGTDQLIGGSGNDKLNGNAGADTLIGGDGRDVLTGGAGNDIFDFNAYSEMGLGTKSRDIITDFVRGQDKIDLSTIDPNLTLVGNQAFKLINLATAFSSPGQIHYSGGIISINTDTDAATEYEIQLTGVIPVKLTTADFIL